MLEGETAQVNSTPAGWATVIPGAAVRGTVNGLITRLVPSVYTGAKLVIAHPWRRRRRTEKLSGDDVMSGVYQWSRASRCNCHIVLDH